MNYVEYNRFYYYGLAVTLFITVCFVVALVRWFHMCRPTDRNPRYYYPGRPFFVLTFLSALVLIPYALHPDSADSWYLTRVYFLPVTLSHFTFLLFSYFGNIMEWKRWRGPMLAIGTPIILTLAVALVLAIWPGDQLVDYVNPALAGCLLYIPGAISTAVCFSAITIVRVWERRFNEDDYSNPNDFPVVMSRRWTRLTLINMALCWTAVLLNDQDIMAIIMLLFSVSAILILLSALLPHRNAQIEEDSAETDLEAESTSKSNIPKKTLNEILSSIHIVVVEQQAYLESHLTIQDVADRCGYSRSYIASIIKSEYGGFFNYINGLRLQNVAIYHEQHPDATIQEAAEASGFTSRQAYYKVKATLEKQSDPKNRY